MKYIHIQVSVNTSLDIVWRIYKIGEKKFGLQIGHTQ